MSRQQNRDGRQVPSALPSEEALLGAILIRQSILGEVLDQIEPRDFYKPVHQHVFAAMQALHQMGQAIDGVTVADELRKAGLLDEAGGSELLLGLQDATPSTSGWKRYTDSIVDTSRRRSLLWRLIELTDKAYDGSTDVDDIIEQATILNTDGTIASRVVDDNFPDLLTLSDIETRDAARIELDEWLIPGMIRRLWRIILVAGEGVGKAVFMRFLGMHMAAGRHPWSPTVAIEPRRVLYVDFENPEETIAHQLRLANRSEDYSLWEEAKPNFFTWHREGGVDLRSRRGRVDFEDRIRMTQPDCVMLGPLYKAFRKVHGEDMESAAAGFCEVIDDLRTRHRFAIMLEHHSPKASGGAYRELAPFGSSLFLRWPEMGPTLEIDSDDPKATRYPVKVGRFRRDRVTNDWPSDLFVDYKANRAFFKGLRA